MNCSFHFNKFISQVCRLRFLHHFYLNSHYFISIKSQIKQRYHNEYWLHVHMDIIACICNNTHSKQYDVLRHALTEPLNLTHWGRVTHICVSKLTIIGSDNGYSPGRRQAIIWTNAGILLIRTLGTNFSEILSEIRASSFKKMHWKMSSAKWHPFCLGLNVLMHTWVITPHISDNLHMSESQ